MSLIEKKTIVLDIDETLVYATQSLSEQPENTCDTTIKIKVNKYGGCQKAYLSFRPYLFEMLEELSRDFELILYTCGTKSYAEAFAESLSRLYLQRLKITLQDGEAEELSQSEQGRVGLIRTRKSNTNLEFSFFDHILSL